MICLSAPAAPRSRCASQLLQHQTGAGSSCQPSSCRRAASNHRRLLSLLNACRRFRKRIAGTAGSKSAGPPVLGAATRWKHGACRPWRSTAKSSSEPCFAEQLGARPTGPGALAAATAAAAASLPPAARKAERLSVVALSCCVVPSHRKLRLSSGQQQQQQQQQGQQ